MLGLMKNEMTDETCTWCGGQLNEEEVTDPRTDGSGETICDACYIEHFTEVCSRCDESVETSEFSAEPTQLIAVWRDAPGLGESVRAGYYLVARWPIYADGMIEAFLYSDNLRRVADLDEKGRAAAENAPTPAAPLCRTCRSGLHERWKDQIDRIEKEKA